MEDVVVVDEKRGWLELELETLCFKRFGQAAWLLRIRGVDREDWMIDLGGLRCILETFLRGARRLAWVLQIGYAL
jgi:hypothetical protein